MINKIILVSKTLPLYSDLECGPAPTYMRKNIRDLTVTAQYSWLVLLHAAADIQKKKCEWGFFGSIYSAEHFDKCNVDGHETFSFLHIHCTKVNFDRISSG